MTYGSRRAFFSRSFFLAFLAVGQRFLLFFSASFKRYRSLRKTLHGFFESIFFFSSGRSASGVETLGIIPCNTFFFTPFYEDLSTVIGFATAASKNALSAMLASSLYATKCICCSRRVGVQQIGRKKVLFEYLGQGFRSSLSRSRRVSVQDI